VHAVGYGTEWQQREKVPDPNEQRVPWRMLDAEKIARQDEKPVVLHDHAARRGRGIEGEQDGENGHWMPPIGRHEAAGPAAKRH
jgi:hypothetical protein